MENLNNNLHNPERLDQLCVAHKGVFVTQIRRQHDSIVVAERSVVPLAGACAQSRQLTEHVESENSNCRDSSNAKTAHAQRTTHASASSLVAPHASQTDESIECNQAHGESTKRVDDGPAAAIRVAVL